MIGLNMFNAPDTESEQTSVGDISEAEYISAFPSSAGKAHRRTRLLIDIVCPQPRSQRHVIELSQSRQAQKITRQSR